MEKWGETAVEERRELIGERSSLIRLSDQSGLLSQKVSSHFAFFGHNIKSECKLPENSEYFQSNIFFSLQFTQQKMLLHLIA